ncbi:hypothetical protein PTKIN_Ptkin01aG0127200 [Pterospermum kingtungense]
MYAVVKGKKGSTPSYNEVYGVVSGDTCFAITKMFNLTTKFFDSIKTSISSVIYSLWVSGFVLLEKHNQAAS